MICWHTLAFDLFLSQATNLGLAYTTNEAVLSVSVGNDGYINVIEICTSDNPRVFFSILFAAVHCLIKKPLLSATPGVVPFKHLEFYSEGLPT